MQQGFNSGDYALLVLFYSFFFQVFWFKIVFRINYYNYFIKSAANEDIFCIVRPASKFLKKYLPATYTRLPTLALDFSLKLTIYQTRQFSPFGHFSLSGYKIFELVKGRYLVVSDYFYDFAKEAKAQLKS